MKHPDQKHFSKERTCYRLADETSNKTNLEETNSSIANAPLAKGEFRMVQSARIRKDQEVFWCIRIRKYSLATSKKSRCVFIGYPDEPVFREGQFRHESQPKLSLIISDVDRLIKRIGVIRMVTSRLAKTEKTKARFYWPCHFNVFYWR